MKSLIAFAAALAGCAATAHDAPPSSTEEDPAIAAMNLPPLAPDALRVVAPTVRSIEPGRDITYCTYIANPFGRRVDVVQSLGHQSKFGHHALLMQVIGSKYQPGDSHECTDEDMTTARFLAGGSDAAQNIQIPEGIGFRIEPSATLMVQTHWINTSGAPADGHTVFDVSAREPDEARKTAQLFTVLTTRVSLPPRSRAQAKTECTIREDLTLFDFGGHEHEWGTHVKVDRVREGATDVLYDHDWLPEYQSSPPIENFTLDAPLVLRKGDVLRVTCDYENTTTDTIRFPREMCVAFGFYFPATSDIQCVDDTWVKP